MKKPHPTGLGHPQPAGKLSLFQPPPDDKKMDQYGDQDHKKIPSTRKRIRTTIDLTMEALVILQQVQQEYRLKTGKVLPLWRALSQVISAYHAND
jgi:hypothetical protein